MFGCCSAASHKYISKKGVVDVQALKKLFGEETEVIQGHDGLRIKLMQKVDPDNLTSDEMALVFSRQSLPEQTLRTHQLCTCTCHIEGTVVDC